MPNCIGSCHGHILLTLLETEIDFFIIVWDEKQLICRMCQLLPSNMAPDKIAFLHQANQTVNWDWRMFLLPEVKVRVNLQIAAWAGVIPLKIHSRQCAWNVKLWNMSHISKYWVPRPKISQVLSWKLCQLDSNLKTLFVDCSDWQWWIRSLLLKQSPTTHRCADGLILHVNLARALSFPIGKQPVCTGLIMDGPLAGLHEETTCGWGVGLHAGHTGGHDVLFCHIIWGTFEALSFVCHTSLPCGWKDSSSRERYRFFPLTTLSTYQQPFKQTFTLLIEKEPNFQLSIKFLSLSQFVSKTCKSCLNFELSSEKKIVR